MPNRRGLQAQIPAMPMTGSGTGDQAIEEPDPSMQMIESPETRRRRLTPAVGFPTEQPTTLQQLLSMVKGNS